jgi:ABC-type antimicrobial peptide transport system permease subunit
MYKSNLIVAWRNLIRNLLHSSINIFGLTIGITACFSIFTLIRYEYSFNKNHPDSDRIYRIYSVYGGAFSGVNRGVCGALPVYIKENFSGLENVANFHTWSAKVEIPLNDGSVKDLDTQSDLVIAVPDYIDLVGQYNWLTGSKAILGVPNKVVLIESQAKKYFGELPYDELLGRQIIYSDSLFMEIGGVVSNTKDNTDFAFTDILSFATIKSTWLKDNYADNDWGSTNSSSQLFVKLSEGTPIDNLNEQLESAAEKGDAETDSEWTTTFSAQPLSDIHYNTEIGVFDNVSHVANLDTLRKLNWIAIALLVIAAINFINLETALATKRSHEVGIRKVLGSSRVRLVFHFLNESFMITTAAVALSIPLIMASISIFKDYIPEGVSFNLSDTTTLIYLGLTIAIVGLLAGLYPAFVMSSFSPVKSLKNQSGRKNSLSANLRKGLTIFQFGFSQILIIGTVIVGLQIHYMHSKDLGFETKSILYFYTSYYAELSKKDVLKNELQRIPEISSLSNFGNPPAQRGYSTSITKFINDKGDEIMSNAHQKSGDTTYIPFFGLKFAAGRNYRPNAAGKETVINETFARELGFEDSFDALGNIFRRGNDTLTIVGVLEDFHFRSLHHKIEPIMITLDNTARSFGIKMTESANTDQVIEKIKNEYAKVYPDRTFAHYFLDETVEQFYKTEQRASKLAITATAIAIIISCLGLFGLASFTAVQRTKEIGIRKVLGATADMIVSLLSKDFLKLVLISIVISVPIAYWIGELWLEDFAYKIPISGWIFVLSGLGSILIAFLTVSYQSIKAAMADPAESLRYE